MNVLVLANADCDVLVIAHFKNVSAAVELYVSLSSHERNVLVRLGVENETFAFFHAVMYRTAIYGDLMLANRYNSRLAYMDAIGRVDTDFPLRIVVAV